MKPPQGEGPWEEATINQSTTGEPHDCSNYWGVSKEVDAWKNVQKIAKASRVQGTAKSPSQKHSGTSCNIGLPRSSPLPSLFSPSV